MRRHTIWLLVLLAAAAGYAGGRAGYASAPASNYDMDAAEMDRTQENIIARVRAMNEQLKAMAKEVTLKNIDDPEKVREKKIGESIQPIVMDAQILFTQTFLLTLDNVIETGGQEAEVGILAMLSKQLDVPIRELAGRTEKANLGIGGVALGYAIAKAAKLPPDEIFANKADNKSWPEVMRARQVSLAQVQAAFQPK